MQKFQFFHNKKTVTYCIVKLNFLLALNKISFILPLCVVSCFVSNNVLFLLIYFKPSSCAKLLIFELIKEKTKLSFGVFLIYT